MWGGADIGALAAISAKAVYYCLGSDPTFGFVKPMDYSNLDLQTVLLSPWT